jgi:hypothetical protein
MADLTARIKPKKSSTAGEVPQASDLEVAELAVNTADGKLFVKHTDDSIKEISGGGGGGDIVSAGDFSYAQNQDGGAFVYSFHSYYSGFAGPVGTAGWDTSYSGGVLACNYTDANAADFQTYVEGQLGGTIGGCTLYLSTNGVDYTAYTVSETRTNYNGQVQFHTNDNSLDNAFDWQYAPPLDLWLKLEPVTTTDKALADGDLLRYDAAKSAFAISQASLRKAVDYKDGTKWVAPEYEWTLVNSTETVYKPGKAWVHSPFYTYLYFSRYDKNGIDWNDEISQLQVGDVVTIKGPSGIQSYTLSTSGPSYNSTGQNWLLRINTSADPFTEGEEILASSDNPVFGNTNKAFEFKGGEVPVWNSYEGKYFGERMSTETLSDVQAFRTVPALYDDRQPAYNTQPPANGGWGVLYSNSKTHLLFAKADANGVDMYSASPQPSWIGLSTDGVKYEYHPIASFLPQSGTYIEVQIEGFNALDFYYSHSGSLYVDWAPKSFPEASKVLKSNGTEYSAEYIAIEEASDFAPAATDAKYEFTFSATDTDQPTSGLATRWSSYSNEHVFLSTTDKDGNDAETDLYALTQNVDTVVFYVNGLKVYEGKPGTINNKNLSRISMYQLGGWTSHLNPGDIIGINSPSWTQTEIARADGESMVWNADKGNWENLAPVPAIGSLALTTDGPAALHPDTKVAISGSGANGATTATNLATANSGDATAVNDATLSDAQSKFYSTAMSFDGSTDAFSIAHDDEQNLGANDFTVQCWVYFNVLTSGLGYAIAGKGNTATNDRGWDLLYNHSTSADATWNFTRTANGFSPSTKIYTMSATHRLEVGKWYHIRMCQSGGGSRIHINGTCEGGNVAVAAAEWASTVDLKIGARYTANSNSINGYINDFQIINGTALSTNTNSFAVPAYGLAQDVPNDPTDGQVLTWNDANSQWEPAAPAVDSNVTQGGTGSNAVNNLVTISQVDYDALGTPDANTVYFIV